MPFWHLKRGTTGWIPRSWRQLLASNTELARKLKALEQKYDSQFKVVFNAIRELMTPPEPDKKRPIGFGPWED